MKRYRIRYTDSHDPCCPVFACIVKAYDRVHAEEVFFESGEDGWKVVSIKKI